jgi:DNA-binding GntR family transcriptional regulator
MAAPKFDNATLAERVHQLLREDILANKYPPNEPLPEEVIAASLDVSRAPVREALRNLAAEGLVKIIRRQGAVVNSLSAQEFLEAYQIREALEVLALRLAFPHLQQSHLTQLESLNREMTNFARGGFFDKFFSADANFHSLFVEQSNNQKLQEVYCPIANQMRRYYIPAFDLKGGIERAIEEHQNIIYALKDGDSQQAAIILSEHLKAPQHMLQAGKSIELIPFAHSPEG